MIQLYHPFFRKLVLLASLCLITFSSAFAQSFSTSFLDFNGNGGVTKGTSLMFGPDGRLYVTNLVGEINIFTVQRNGVDDYVVIANEELLDVKNIPNHNDDGTAHTTTKREVTGLTVTGTAANPVIYVTSSDHRFGGPGGDLGLDTNSGVITRLTWNGTSWDVVDMVRGLPRSEENHATNGLEFVTISGTDYLIVCSGGHTNAGSPSDNFAWTTEYALSAAVLSINLTQLEAMPILTDGGRQYIYDIPTLDDPTRANVNGITDPDDPGYDGIDVGDPWGGNDGLNQAMVVPGGPVQVFSPGYRNAYDLVLTESGAVYVTDNGANGGWGGLPINEGGGSVTNGYDPSEPGSGSSVNGEQVNNKDHLHIITNDITTYTSGSFYGGHPVPVRANPTGAGLYTNPSFNNTNNAVFRTQTYDPDGSTPGSTTDPNVALPANWPPVPTANAVEGDFRAPGAANPDGPVDDLVTLWGTNTNGIDEYTASNFGGAMQGDLIAGKNGGVLRRVQLNPDGSLLSLNQDFITGLNGNALGVTCNGDGDPYPGSIWVATFNDDIAILEPQDFVICVPITDPAYDANADNDSDGYTNQDEEDNGTDRCNGGSQPGDFDRSAGGTLVSDLNDTDDDNDGILDANDPFQLGDPTDSGSDAFDLPVLNELFSDNPTLKGYLGLGFTGMMNNGAANPNWLNWLDRRDDPNDPNPNDILGGAVGAMTMQMTSGTALGATNTQEKGFQYGVNVDASTGGFSVSSRLFNFTDPTQIYGNPLNGEIGIFMGDGTQSNYIKVVLTKAGVTAQMEVADVPQTPINIAVPVANRPTNDVVFAFNVNALTGDVQVTYSFDGATPVVMGTIAAQGAILNSITQAANPLAVGFIGTSNAVGVEVEGTWDYLRVEGDAPTVSQQLPDLEKFISDPPVNIDLENYFSDNGGAQNLTYTVESNTNPSIGASITNSTLTVTIPASANTSTLTIRATDAGGLFVEQSFVVNVTDEPVVLFRINAGDVLVPATDAPKPDWEANSGTGVQSGTNWSVNTGNISTHNIVNLHSSVPAYAPVSLFAKERWDPPSNPQMEWTFTVGNGVYVVNLFMGNGFNGTSQPGKRVFDIIIEGDTVAKDLDLSATYGHKVGAMASYQVNVVDGTLNVAYNRNANDPIVNAIEILGIGVGFPPIFIGQFAAETIVEGQTVYLPVSASGGNTDENFTFAANNLPPGLSIEPTTGVIFGTVAAGAIAGSPYNVEVIVDKPSSTAESMFFTMSVGATGFPVTWLGIDAKKSDEGIAVSWETATEINSDFFEVQRQYATQEFVSIGKVKAAGTSDMKQTYGFLDGNAPQGMLRYRLRQVDIDGDVDFSPTVEIYNRLEGLAVYPNPTTGIITLEFTESFRTREVLIYDLSGQELINRKVNGEAEVTMNLSTYANGWYLIEIVSETGARSQHRIFKSE